MTHQAATLPKTGYIRQPVLIGDPKTGKVGILPFSASTLWRRVRAGAFPAPVKLSARMTAWKAEDVHCWLADPVNYQAEKANA